MKVPTNPFRIPRGRRKRKREERQEVVYSIRDCVGCVSGCKEGKECKPALGYVHGRCLHAYGKDRFTLVDRVDRMPEGDCLSCGEPLGGIIE